MQGRTSPRKITTPDEPGPEFRFAAVRHPLDRLVSCWAFMARTPHGGFRKLGYEPGMEFSNFLSIAFERYEENRHTQPQSEFIGPHEVYACRVEHLGTAWEWMRERFSYLDPLERLNTTKHAGRELFSPDQRRRAEEIFAADMALYERATQGALP